MYGRDFTETKKQSRDGPLVVASAANLACSVPVCCLLLCFYGFAILLFKKACFKFGVFILWSTKAIYLCLNRYAVPAEQLTDNKEATSTLTENNKAFSYWFSDHQLTIHAKMDNVALTGLIIAFTRLLICLWDSSSNCSCVITLLSENNLPIEKEDPTNTKTALFYPFPYILVVQESFLLKKKNLMCCNR